MSREGRQPTKPAIVTREEEVIVSPEGDAVTSLNPFAACLGPPFGCVFDLDPPPDRPPVLVRRRSRAIVTSLPLSLRNERYLTRIVLERTLWQECGFCLDDGYLIRRGRIGVEIVRSHDGAPPPRIEAASVTLLSTALGNLDYERLHVLAGPGAITL